jgi:hypothetical protein
VFFSHLNEVVDKNGYLNIFDEKNPDRFIVSPLVLLIAQQSHKPFKTKDYSLDRSCFKHYSELKDTEDQYTISLGVCRDPEWWSGTIKGMDNLFDLLCEDYKKDLISGRAKIIIDSSHEGHHAEWLWDWFHYHLERYGIQKKQCIFVTGNWLAERQYENWCLRHDIEDKINVISHFQFEPVIYGAASEKENLLSTFEQLNYKKENLENVALYNCLQKRPRAHRLWMVYYLKLFGLLDDGINTCNTLGNGVNEVYMLRRRMSKRDIEELRKILPLFENEKYMHYGKEFVNDFVDGDCGLFLTKLNEEIMYDSWLSVVSEASFSEEDTTCFISEKTFKPIAVGHPFIIYGNKHSLRYLRDLGYQTFSPYINEAYDDLNGWDRLIAIVKELERIKSFTNQQKVDWFKQIIPILKHNKSKIEYNCRVLVPSSIEKVEKAIQC